MVICHSINANWVVGTFSGGGDTVNLPSVFIFMWTFALRGGGETFTTWYFIFFEICSELYYYSYSADHLSLPVLIVAISSSDKGLSVVSSVKWIIPDYWQITKVANIDQRPDPHVSWMFSTYIVSTFLFVCEENGSMICVLYDPRTRRDQITNVII